MPDLKNGAVVVLYVAGVLVLSIVARIGWELGGRLWAAF